MNMSDFIMQVLQSQLVKVWSWGVNRAMVIEDGLSFLVNGYKFKGEVRVIYCIGTDTFKVEFVKNGKVVDTEEDVYVDNLVDVIDANVEKVKDYEERVKSDYF